MTEPELPIVGEAEPREIRRMSRRSFLWASAAMATTYGMVKWLGTRGEDGGTPWPFRRALEFNESIAKDAFGNYRLAPVFENVPLSDRQNGDEGLSEDFDPDAWKLTLSGVHEKEDFELTLAELQKFPHVEMTTEFKCIEGWSAYMHWKGIRLADLAAKYPPITIDGNAPDVANAPQNLVRYVSMMTPDGGYFVGLDMASALHPQTLLAWEMNGKPLTLDHGAPLRLVIPTKYGVKNIKRIGTISFTNERPRDFWAEQGYDWYAGL